MLRVEGAEPIPVKQIFPYDMHAMVVHGEHCSMTERRADDATREVQAWLKCEYLQEHVGDEFNGVISAVTSFGLFVELEDMYIEGLVHITALPGDYYNFDASTSASPVSAAGAAFQLGGRCGCRWPGSTSMTRRSTWSWWTASHRASPKPVKAGASGKVAQGGKGLAKRQGGRKPAGKSRGKGQLKKPAARPAKVSEGSRKSRSAAAPGGKPVKRAPACDAHACSTSTAYTRWTACCARTPNRCSACWVQQGRDDKRIAALLELARNQGVPVAREPRQAWMRWSAASPGCGG